MQRAALADAPAVVVIAIGDVADDGGTVGIADPGQLIGIVVGIGSHDAVGQRRRC
jgi:hypothetical protein